MKVGQNCSRRLVRQRRALENRQVCGGYLRRNGACSLSLLSCRIGRILKLLKQGAAFPDNHLKAQFLEVFGLKNTCIFFFLLSVL